MLRTALCKALGIQHPIIGAPMGPDLSGPDLVAAVSGAGGLGILQAQLHPPPLLREQIHRIRRKTDKPFGVNFILSFPHEAGVALCLEEKVPVISFFWGDPSPLVEDVHQAGAMVFHQVGSVTEARRAADAGVDAVIAQGVEAGGHLAGQVSTFCLVPRVVDSVSIPVVAAGGVADGRGLAAALALGAQAAAVGTRFLATPEANAHPVYKRRILESGEDDTLRTTLFGGGWPNAPHRALLTPFVREWRAQEERGNQQRPDEPMTGTAHVGGQTFPIQRFMSFPPNAAAEGDIDSWALLAGQGVGLVAELTPAAQLVQRMVQEAEATLSRLRQD